jgi:hypothetical protein
VYLGQEQGRKLVYAGKVEHGFTEQQMKHLFDRSLATSPVGRSCAGH